MSKTVYYPGSKYHETLILAPSRYQSSDGRNVVAYRFFTPFFRVVFDLRLVTLRLRTGAFEEAICKWSYSPCSQENHRHEFLSVEGPLFENVGWYWNRYGSEIG